MKKFWGFVCVLLLCVVMAGAVNTAKVQAATDDKSKVTYVDSSDKKIYSLHIDLGYLFVGSTVPEITSFSNATENNQASLGRGFVWNCADQTGAYNGTLTVGSKIGTVLKHKVSATLYPKSGYAFADNMDVYFKLNGNSEKGTIEWIDEASVVVSFEFKPTAAPVVTINIPDEVKAGDDIVKLSAACNMVITGATDVEKIISVNCDGELMLLNVTTDGKWMATDTASYLKTYEKENGELTPAEKAEFYQMFQAKAGKKYTFSITPYISDVHGTNAENFKIYGGAKATVKAKKPESLLLTVDYDCKAPSVNSVSVGFTKPKTGDLMTGLTATAGSSQYYIAGVKVIDAKAGELFTCGKKYTVAIDVKTSGSYIFEDPMKTSVSVSGFQASVGGYTADNKCITVMFTLELEHTKISEATEVTCTQDGVETTKCAICGVPIETHVTKALGHDLTKVDATEGDCMNAGTVEYYSCGRCHKMFSDALGTKEITSITGSKNPRNHVGGEMKHDANYHWIHCKCGEDLTGDEHTWDKNYKCTVCGYQSSKEAVEGVTPPEGSADAEITPDPVTPPVETSDTPVGETPSQDTPASEIPEGTAPEEGVTPPVETATTPMAEEDDAAAAGEVTPVPTAPVSEQIVDGDGMTKEKKSSNTGLYILASSVVIAGGAVGTALILRKRKIK